MRVLVAEDHADSRELVTENLQDWGHQVMSAADGDEAFALHQRNTFDVVVTDWRMPNRDGIDLTRAIRAGGGDYSWIILLTANDFDANFAMAMEAGVDDFLQKPLNARLLEARIGVASRVLQLRKKVEELSSFVPICMHCKAVRDEDQRWQSIENFLNREAHVATSHGMCPPCYYERSLRPDVERAIAAGSGSVRSLDSELRQQLKTREPAPIALAIGNLETALTASISAIARVA